MADPDTVQVGLGRVWEGIAPGIVLEEGHLVGTAGKKCNNSSHDCNKRVLGSYMSGWVLEMPVHHSWKAEYLWRLHNPGGTHRIVVV